MGCLVRSMDMMGEGGDGTLLVSRHLASSTPFSTPFGFRRPRIAAWGCYRQWREAPLPVVALPYWWRGQLDPLPRRAVAQLFKCEGNNDGTLQRHQLHRQKLGQEQLQQQPHHHHGHRQHQEQSNQQQLQQQHPVSLLRRSSSVVISMKGDTGGSSCGGSCCSCSFSSGWYSALLTTSFFLGDVSASLHAGDCLICTVVANKTRSRTGITVQCSTLGRQLGVHRLRHGLIVVEVEVRPAAGVQVVGALDAEERLVGRHAPLGL
ncbi:unnamed protein product [Miscanthus lutarioriparius]|uniref:Uncharacterized protein n=1 Tax=Miscanthus lutarioriparius TaxID=422564 RepID=A0A811QAP6_9POAL|nr:unnamed protein product [Miscanthus lutarioriparius]